MMTFIESIKTCFAKYAEFNGRALRSEFWWWALFTLMLDLGTAILDPSLNLLAALVVLVPGLAVTARRLHDTGRSGWWQLIWLIPVIGWIILIVWLAQRGQEADNRFGAPPTGHPTTAQPQP